MGIIWAMLGWEGDITLLFFTCDGGWAYAYVSVSKTRMLSIVKCDIHALSKT